MEIRIIFLKKEVSSKPCKLDILNEIFSSAILEPFSRAYEVILDWKRFRYAQAFVEWKTRNKSWLIIMLALLFYFCGVSNQTCIWILRILVLIGTFHIGHLKRPKILNACRIPFEMTFQALENAPVLDFAMSFILMRISISKKCLIYLFQQKLIFC